MALLVDNYLGTTSMEIFSNSCVATIVNYNAPVSEEWHSHENLHLSVILKGGNLESRKKGNIEVIPGKTILYNKGEVHRNTHTQFPSKNLNLEFSDTYIKENNLVFEKFSDPDLIMPDNLVNFIRIYNEMVLSDLYSSKSIEYTINSIFTIDEKSSARPPWLKEVKEIIANRWDEIISLDQLANEVKVHPVTLSKYFRRYYNMTLTDYMRKLKLEKSLKLLLNSNKPITEIAMECGFSDHSHMIRLFKFYLGFKPTDIRRL